MNSRTCTKCGEEKSTAEFPKDRAKKDGISPRCKACNSAYTAEYYAANKERIAEYQRKYRRERVDVTSEIGQRRYQKYLKAQDQAEAQVRAENEAEERRALEAAFIEARINVSQLIAKRDALDMELRWEAWRTLKAGDRKGFKELDRERKARIRALNKEIKNILE